MVLTHASRRPSLPPVRRDGPVLSDCDGPLDQIVIHYISQAAPIVTQTYREFLGDLDSDVTVHVICPDEDAFEELRASVGEVACTLRPVVTGHAMTTWSRDRWLALAPPPEGGATIVLSPREEKAAEIWPAILRKLRRLGTEVGV